MSVWEWYVVLKSIEMVYLTRTVLTYKRHLLYSWCFCLQKLWGFLSLKTFMEIYGQWQCEKAAKNNFEICDFSQVCSSLFMLYRPGLDKNRENRFRALMVSKVSKYFGTGKMKTLVHTVLFFLCTYVHPRSLFFWKWIDSWLDTHESLQQSQASV